ncbi:MAG: ATP-dependent DNA helicase RecG [Lachnospiraceae bacterium]|nr:ATP-dependent DNA helicase RecG [Lachnospiraceae bacterium]
MQLNDPITAVKGIGEKTAEAFCAAGIYTVNGLLHYFPRNYETMPEMVQIREISRPGRYTVRARILTPAAVFRSRGKAALSFRIGDGSGQLKVSIFGMPYLKKQIYPGRECIFSGNCSFKGTEALMSQPKFLTDEEYAQLQNRLQPVYPLRGELTNQRLRKALTEALPAAEEIREYLPEDILENEHLLPIPKAIRLMHFPERMEEVYAARKRLAFDEFFLFLARMELLKQGPEKEISGYVYPIADTEAAVQEFLAKLPYPLTGAQERTIRQIRQDMASGFCMNRLVQGDVGSGKTIVAFTAALVAVCHGAQAALMAPTEVLAAQHYSDILRMSAEYGLPFTPVLLSGSLKAKEKREAKERIRSGEANFLIGTHALIQEDVEAKDLALIITDEQHRFGVRQRIDLARKGAQPHVLVMSATPIPRTLGLILYGDLDVSLIDELPAKRLPIKNTVVDGSYRTKLYQFILKRISEGRQAYIICPMVEEGEEGTAGLANVVDYTEELRAKFPPQIRIDMLHGRMKPKEKNEVMQRFAEGGTDLLISTTVVEVGVNVPNATVMMVENAERFGLAQLHQLRGRVGRGEWQSYCMFVAGEEDKKMSKRTQERLHILNETNDGFRIAEEDLKQRGPGDFFGLRQSGLPYFKIADIYTDAELLKRVKAVVERICRNEPERVRELREELKAREQMDYVDFHGICL